MDRSSQVNLISVTYTQDAIMQDVATETSRTVFCNISSVSGDEFSRAGQMGIKAEYRITMFKFDYQNEKVVEINNKRYQVYRTYEGRNDTLELYVEQRVGV